MRSLACKIQAAAFAVLAAFPAAAEEWDALVLGLPGAGAERAFADAFHASEALRLSLEGAVTLLRDTSADAIVTELETLAAAPRALLYYAGPLVDGGMVAQGRTDPRLTLDAILARLAAGGVQDVALLIEDCVGRDGVPMGLDPLDVPEGLALYAVASAGAGAASCPDDAARLTDLLDRAPFETGPGLQASLDALPVLADTGLDVNLFAAAPGTQRAQDTAAPDRSSPVVVLPASGGAAVSPVVVPVTARASAATPLRTAPQSAADGETVVVFAPPPQSQLAALPLAAGLPQPSIIVGIIEEVQQASFGIAPEEPPDPSGTEIAYDNLEARRALRSQSPELFASLVSGGAFDPPRAILPRALQTELARMGCYTAGIDGIWGNGSRASVERYFAQIAGVSATSLEPEIALFRQILLQDNVTCPPPAPVARVTPRNTPSSTQRATAPQTQRSTPAPTTQRATTTRRQPAQAQSAPASDSNRRKIDPSRLRMGSGVGR